MRHTYEECSISGSKSGKCALCKKQVTRKRTVTHTINPFNKNADGIPKNRSEVYECVKAELADWKKLPVRHAKCEQGKW